MLRNDLVTSVRHNPVHDMTDGQWGWHRNVEHPAHYLVTDDRDVRGKVIG